MKKIMTLLLVGGMIFSTVGCSGSKTTNTTNPVENKKTVSGQDARNDSEKEPVSIKHWYWADNTDYSAVMQDIVKLFNETNQSNITVVAEEYPWDGGGYSNTLFNAVMGGGGPDTAAWKLTATPLFTANNLLADLDDLIGEWEDKEDIDENLYNVMKQAGGTDSINVMPWNTQILYVYYRPSMFEEVDIEVPTTYEEFLEACKLLTRDTDGDGKVDIYGFGMRGAKGGQEPWGSFVYGRGGNFEDLTTAEAIEGMQDFIDLYQNGYVPPTAPTDGFNEIIANFKSGRTAMTIHHTGSAEGIVEIFGEDVSAFPFPKGEGQWTSMGDTENVIFESCANKEAAFEWVSFLATGEGQKMWCEATGNVPVSKTVQGLDFYQNNKFMKASIEGMSYAGILPILDTTTEWISVTWPNEVGLALSGKASAEQTMQKLQEELYR